MMKIFGVITALAVAALLYGCQTGGQQGSVVGTWECLDVTNVYDGAVIKKCFVTFDSNGTASSRLVNSSGDDISEPKCRYHCDGNIMWFDDDTNNIRRISIRGDEMTMTIERSINPEDVGMTLKHRRVK